MQVLPRQFTAHQQGQILDWEAAKRWRVLPAGTIFPAVVRYPPPSVLGGGSLIADRAGIAKQASCRSATDAVVAAVLARDGCQAVLRATYVDRTDSYVVTVGVAAFPGMTQAAAAEQALGSPTVTRAKGPDGSAVGVLTVKVTGTPAAWFDNDLRQVSARQVASAYVIFYTIGYADTRPIVPVESNPYAYAEMTSLGAGVADAVQNVLAVPLPQPHCPGTAGC